MLMTRRQKVKIKRSVRRILIALVLFLLIFDIARVYVGHYAEPEKFISPLPENYQHEPTATITPTPRVAEIKKSSRNVKPRVVRETLNFLEGVASYYSVAGCIGCSPTLTMANGERLSDEDLTVALTPELVNEKKLLNDLVTVINLTNGKEVQAKVTDTGGFGKLGRVADLSLATKNAINCSDLCNVNVIFD